MSTQKTMEEKLQALEPEHLEIINESHLHAGPASDSHFKLVVVSNAFAGVRKVARHQKLYKMLASELQGPVHALSLFLYTPDEWQQADVPNSPNCQGAGQ